MQRLVAIGLALVLIVALTAPLLAAASPDGTPTAAGPKPFLIFTSGDLVVNEAARDALTNKGGQVVNAIPITRDLYLMFVLVPDQALAVLGEIARIPGVLEISPDQPPELLVELLPWGVNRIDADLAWGSVTGAGVSIAIVDTGIDLDHPDLATNLATIGNANCIDTPDDSCSTALLADDGYGHGTHVAGIAAAVDNDIGVIGVAPGATLLSVKIFNDAGGSSFTAAVNGIRYVSNTGATRRADVMNMSFGWSKNLAKQCPSCVTTLQTVINEAWSQGVVPVAAAGNSGNKAGSGDNIGYPARLNSVVAVGATDSQDRRASFSSTGPTLDLAAPGVSIYSTYKDGGYATMSGTSMASPHVAGAAALVVQSLGAGWSNGAVVNQLTSTADDLGTVGRDSLYGYGLVDAQQAATGVETTP